MAAMPASVSQFHVVSAKVALHVGWQLCALAALRGDIFDRTESPVFTYTLKLDIN